MRYCIVATNYNLSQVIEEVGKADGRNIKVAKYPSGTSASGDSPVENISGMVFAELTAAAVHHLGSIPGLLVKNIQQTKSPGLLQVAPPAPPVIASKACYDANAAIIYSRWAEFRNLFSPPLTGQGLTCAIFGSGIHKSHRTLKGKVVYERNFSGSPTLDDVFDHDTGTAYLIAGGELSEAEQSGLSPGAKLWNIKVLNDEGEATTEELILAMAHVQELYEAAMMGGELPIGDPMYVNAVNLSLGTEDDGDPDNPVRIAIEKLYHSSPGRFPIFASAGNSGKEVSLPAAHEHVWAVGSCRLVPFELCEFSSRGSKTGLIKPEVVMFGENLMVASSKSNDAFTIKTGTSFSSPLCLGVLTLIREAADRLGVLEDILYIPYEELEPYVAMMCTKPEGVSLGKTEEGWGYGLPLGNLFAQQFQAPAPAMDMSAMVSQITPIITLSMLSTMLIPMMKGIKL